MYQSAFQLPSITTRDVLFVYTISSQTITSDAGLLCRNRMKVGQHIFSQEHPSRVQPSEYYTENRDSSEKTALCHSCIQICRSVHHSCHLFICWIVKGSRNKSREDRPRSCKRRCTVRVESRSAENMSISWLMLRDIVIWFCNADFTICLSSWDLVMGGRWDPACLLVWISANNWLPVQCMDVDQCDGWYHGTIIHTLDR